MENSNYGQELNPPPSYEPLKEPMDFRNYPGQTVQSTVVTMGPEDRPIQDHVIWSTFNTVFLNFCCLGFLAYVFSIKSRDRKLYGDRNGATNYGSTARSLNIAASVLSILFFLATFVIYFMYIVEWARH